MRSIKGYNYTTSEWYDMEWSNVVSGTKIKIFEEDGTAVVGNNNDTEFITVSDAFMYEAENGENVWAVYTKE